MINKQLLLGHVSNIYEAFYCSRHFYKFPEKKKKKKSSMINCLKNTKFKIKHKTLEFECIARNKFKYFKI